jgi:hypothetical protein
MGRVFPDGGRGGVARDRSGITQREAAQKLSWMAHPGTFLAYKGGSESR